MTGKHGEGGGMNSGGGVEMFRHLVGVVMLAWRGGEGKDKRMDNDCGVI